MLVPTSLTAQRNGRASAGVRHRPTTRQAALAAISALPDAASFEEIACRLHVLEAIRAGVEDIEAGRTVSHEQARARLAKWHVG